MTGRLPSGSSWSFIAAASIVRLYLFLSSGLDNSKFNSYTLVTVPNVNPQGFWEASLESASVNGVDTGLVGRTTILDTGGFVICLPNALKY